MGEAQVGQWVGLWADLEDPWGDQWVDPWVQWVLRIQEQTNYILLISPWFSILKILQLLQFIPVVSAIKKFTKTIRLSCASLVVTFGSTVCALAWQRQHFISLLRRSMQ